VPPKGPSTPLKASYGDLLETALHKLLKNVESYVVRLPLKKLTERTDSPPPAVLSTTKWYTCQSKKYFVKTISIFNLPVEKEGISHRNLIDFQLK
jgi:hypothetical protein